MLSLIHNYCIMNKLFSFLQLFVHPDPFFLHNASEHQFEFCSCGKWLGFKEVGVWSAPLGLKGLQHSPESRSYRAADSCMSDEASQHVANASWLPAQ